MVRKIHHLLLLVISLSIPVLGSLGNCSAQNLTEYGRPEIKDEEVFEKTGFIISYDRDGKVPNYVIEYLDESKINPKHPVSRLNYTFHEEGNLSPSDRASNADYLASGYDKGHLGPAADFEWSKDAMYDCFTLSNIAPQTPELNRFVWARLETHVRFLAHKRKVWVITGVIKGAHTIGDNKINVPSQWWKTVLIQDGEDIKLGAWLFDNVKKQLEDFREAVISVDELEETTGLDFWHKLPNQLEAILEAADDAL